MELAPSRLAAEMLSAGSGRVVCTLLGKLDLCLKHRQVEGGKNGCRDGLKDDKETGGQIQSNKNKTDMRRKTDGDMWLCLNKAERFSSWLTTILT